MDASDLRPHRAALVGAVAALAAGLTGGLALRTGPQTAPQAETLFASGPAYPEAPAVAWPGGKVPDYVVGTDFLPAPQTDQPPVVVASYEVPDYVPASWTEPAPEPQVQAPSVQLAEVEAAERTWPSTGGDILDTRLPEDAPPAPEPPQAIDAPEAPMAIAAAY
ncbi:hypothetical protein [Caulobacter sp. UNC279MFTsu5.1]|uniref:hypothetical protein n=1 Tax=Caulobacter sp. UNC279MFTsu5.1 TaxID=1502775 RepID=UPI0008F0FA6B|nr:hypothetical protein [Caulobacter sp. UNC279MFTsu5.1]SFK72408.1 hypothetical protein SAMN02799626_05010 [Caulobacter sp. UNC279MFTsu5.1]